MQKSLVEMNVEELKLLEELASYFFTPREILDMLEMSDTSVEFAMENEIFYTAFQKGRLQSEMELRKSIIKLAKSGSSPAQTMSLDLLKKSQVKMLDK